MIENVSPRMAPKYRSALDIVFNLYNNRDMTVVRIHCDSEFRKLLDEVKVELGLEVIDLQLLRVKNRSFRSFLRSFFDWDGLTLANATSLSCVLHYHSRLFWCFSNVKRNPFSHLVCSLIILMLVKMANFRSSE